MGMHKNRQRGAYKQTDSQTDRQTTNRRTDNQTDRRTDKAQIHACLTVLPSDVPEDIGFCGISDTTDTGCGEIKIQLLLHRNVRRVRCATKVDVCAHFLCQTCKMFRKSQCPPFFASSTMGNGRQKNNAWKAELRLSDKVCVRRVSGHWFLQKVCTRWLYSFKLAPEGESVAKAQNLLNLSRTCSRTCRNFTHNLQNLLI